MMRGHLTTGLWALVLIGVVNCGEPKDGSDGADGPGAAGIAGSPEGGPSAGTAGASPSAGASGAGVNAGAGGAPAIAGAASQGGDGVSGAAGTPSSGAGGISGGAAGATNTLGGAAGQPSAGNSSGGSTPVPMGGQAGQAAGQAGASAAGTGGQAGANTGGAGTGGSAPTCTASTLKDAGKCTDRLIGVALSTRHLQDAAYARNALEFNYATAEDEMKWSNTQPTRGQFTFSAGDRIVDFATQNGMKVKGHTLVWYNQLPSWVSSISNANDLRSVMVNHIQTVMNHYKGKVIAWDVVNEAWDPDNPTALRDSVFTRVLGKSYIDEAFQAARTADPNAKLYYNDYGTDGLSTKANSVYEMVKDMKARGIPIDGVGLQMHWRSVGSTLTAEEVVANIQRLAALGLEVVISEMDVQLCKGGTIEDQKKRYHDIVAACVSQRACTAVTFWGITDKYSWLNSLDVGCTGGEKPRPLLWDDDYAKKPAYEGVLDALLGR